VGGDKLEGVDALVVCTPMPISVHIWSKAFAPTSDPDPYSVQVDRTLWEQAFRREGGRRKFLRIAHPSGLDDWYAPIGQPVVLEDIHGDEETYNIYWPLWMMDSANVAGNGEITTAEILDEESFPEATRIVLRVVDSAFYNSDVKEELERALSSLGVISQHTTLQIPVAALGGFPVEVFVSKTEPANVILCDGEEVALEFEEPVDQIRPPTPIPAPDPVLEPPSMIPVSAPEPQGFQAFQGQGQTLGGSGTSIPEWRRGLPPPGRR
jgi:hypothetical protein